MMETDEEECVGKATGLVEECLEDLDNIYEEDVSALKLPLITKKYLPREDGSTRGWTRRRRRRR
jgi:hypothetical protein